MSDPGLWEAAFGDAPSADPFRPPRTPEEAWASGVALGGRGHYAAALARLGPLLTGRDPLLAALAAATAASHRRQLGAHAAARVLDGRGLAALARVPADHPRLPEARSDVLLGLAADAVGLGRADQVRRLLAEEARGPDPGWRGRIRRGWLAAEAALGAGRPREARAPAAVAHELAAGSGSARHRAKSAMVLGAVLAASGDAAGARPLLSAALDEARRGGFAPLGWPCHLVMADVEPPAADEHRRAAAALLHCVLRHSDARGRQLAADSPWVPDLVIQPLLRTGDEGEPVGWRIR
ncbi:hypothetical protein [Actinokineospora bangkokensis]|uniref:MalT-like TPR region domain-containing protein n=1 Tax=Actinokineospora bangkokensis TaxID=1193682 RepID=A0A1Q9LEY1_9PSEU|nr:hypothetical protein [Actinokineospora bangkokensis]OLR90575.1 hypothetical protein BJP25_28560 [Actinokineospora bangkokensis]